MDIKDFILKAISSFKPFPITINLDKLCDNISIGGKTYRVENGYLIINEETGEKIPLAKDNKGFVRPVIENTVLEGIGDTKKDNVRMLEIERKIFTRADISEAQIKLFNIEKAHERIIEKLKPILQTHKHGTDLGALLSASTIIKEEDEKGNYGLYKKLRGNFATCYSSRGAMIYNLLRSGILNFEVLNHLNKLKKVYNDAKTVKMHFLIYWDSILECGYPTAYFVKEDDTKEILFSEIKWRLEKGIKRIYIYSRTAIRNANTKEWCKSIAKDVNCTFKKFKDYQLGFTRAKKFRLTKKQD